MNYPLQQTNRAFAWYALQGKFYAEFSRWMFLEAGIKEGMNVLDVGTGAGDVAMLLANLVGTKGRVLGIDTSAEAIAAARDRVPDKNVEFLQADCNVVAFPRSFDVVVGRFVLMYAANPSQTLRRLSRLVRRDGFIMFLEPDYSGTRSSEPCPLCSKVQSTIEMLLQRSGADTKMGLKLYRAFTDAGLREVVLRCAAAIGGGSDFSGYEVAAGFLELLAPLAEKHGLALPEELSPSAIAQRMRTEVEESGGAIVFPSIIGAWARLAAEDS